MRGNWDLASKKSDNCWFWQMILKQVVPPPIPLLADGKWLKLNAWGVVDALHKFTGVKMDEPAITRDWILTRIWSLAMDAVALGLVLLVLGGLYLWYRLPAKRLPGLAVLAAGIACCAFFLFGLGVWFG